MNTPDPLEQLRDIQLPEPVGLWPLAWGWWALLTIVLAALVFLLHRRYNAIQKNRYRVQAHRELGLIKEQYQKDHDTARYLQALNVLLRRCMLHLLPHNDIAGLKGEAWLQQLDVCCPNCREGFTTGPGRALLTGPYQAKPQVDAESLYQLTSTWLREHRAPKDSRQVAPESGREHRHA